MWQLAASVSPIWGLSNEDYRPEMSSNSKDALACIDVVLVQ